MLFPTQARETSKHLHLNVLQVCIENTSDTELHLSNALPLISQKNARFLSILLHY